ncbi:HsdM family class I SAM-dependent methyltransferase [Faecalispora anaeroviscerum]|uniref:HsdM family class I SAM-dependent methyltransferase n=1 Tax=Faecalispora anaeroviscerum TaxID=2991836 RepID=UPI0024BA208C|nr:N-6 DNA methylase [Faecalispora anaeroviscerum]
MQGILGSIFSSLDIKEQNGLASDDSKKMTTYQKQFYLHVKEKLNIDAVYFLRDSDGVPKTPLIYFSAMNQYDSQKIAELHRLSWNMGEAPLLFIVLPDQLLIYNNYASPKEKDGKLDPEKGLIETVNLVKKLEAQRKLQKYNRLELESGEYWRKNNERFNIQNRVDTTLINNLKFMRKSLLDRINNKVPADKRQQINPVAIVHGLLGRSILIKYLEERKDSKGSTVFPPNFYESFIPEAKKYTDVLVSKKATYDLFRNLEQHFHGDMFPLIEQEEKVVSQEDLEQLRLFLKGAIDFRNSQLTLWSLYSFNVIPIQLISSIYELFFHLSDTGEDDDKGTYYTPFHLVEMLMDEVLPWEGQYKQIKILDPACGSGIFLVEAYRRIVGKWMYSQSTTKISSEKLSCLMQKYIFGVDCNEEAIRIASFSLSLTMCDYLEPRCIWEELEFPRLVHYNLFISDFFVENGEFEKIGFDIIIGNPPWESQLSVNAKSYITKTRHTIGDKQIAQAFSWKSAELCKPEGVVCLLMPSKGFLFNRSSTNSTYRKEFFDSYDVSVIINYSAFRKVLFEHATGPAVGVIFTPQKSLKTSPIFYCTPKPVYSIEDRRRFLIEPVDICRIPRDIINDDLIWKIAMWGGPRDLDLINKMISMNPTLDVFLQQEGMSKAEGFKRGNRKKSCPEFLTKPMVYAKSVTPFCMDQETLHSLNDDGFECTVEKNRVIFKAPHLLIKQSPKKWNFLAAFLDYDAVFNHSLLGVHGDENVLKYLCILINSKAFSYYQLMTSRRWLVERDELEAGEILSTPIPTPTEEAVNEAVTLYDKISCSLKVNSSEIDSFVYQQFHFTPYETKLVEDAINFVFDYFNAKGKSQALTLPDKESLQTYSEVICDVLKNTLDKTIMFTCKIYAGAAPLSIARINFGGSDIGTIDGQTDNTELNTLLKELDDLLLDQRSESVYVKRNVRVYNKEEVFIIKPNQNRYWTYSAACRDADEIFADIMKAWRNANE